MIYQWQKQQWDMLSSLIEQNKLPHAVLLQGNEGIGKHAFANHLAKSVLCSQPSQTGSACERCESCRVFDAQTHPDLVRLVPQAPENSKSKSPVLNIKIEAIRDLCSKLTRTSQFEGYRVAIIENADHMVVNASNSLLKTLEEPGTDVLIILVSSKPARLPITIRSRCRKIRFEIPETQQALQWLQSEGSQDSALALRMSRGAPLLASLLDDERLSQRKLLSSAFTATLNNEISITYADKLSTIPRQAALDWVFDWVCDVIKLKTCDHDVELINRDDEASLKRLAKTVESQALFRFYDSISESRKSMAIALNPQLFWESLLISWDNLKVET